MYRLKYFFTVYYLAGLHNIYIFAVVITVRNIQKEKNNFK